MTRARKCRESRSNRCGNAEPTPYRIRGVAHAIHVTTANVTVRARALATFNRRRVALSQVQRALADGGLHREAFCRRGAKPVGSPGGSVERYFTWLEKRRRLWKNCESKLYASHRSARWRPPWRR